MTYLLSIKYYSKPVNQIISHMLGKKCQSEIHHSWLKIFYANLYNSEIHLDRLRTG